MTIKWGVMGAAGIARKMFLPAAAVADGCEVVAIASRSKEKGQALADQFGVARVYDSYDRLLADPEIDAIYVPLPNAQHVSATLEALAAGKHVLCEKPIALEATEIATIAKAASDAGRHAIEGFMVAYHPQWQQVRDWIADGEIGQVQQIEGVFTYFLDDADNIRNRADGGALRDIGVYPIFITRWITGQEPKRVYGRMRYGGTAESDLHTSAWMEFDEFDASFYVSARADRSQSITVYGTKGRIEVPNAFNPPNEGPHQIHLFKENEVNKVANFENTFQFALQLESLGKLFNGEGKPLMKLQNSEGNQRVLDAVIESNRSGRWVNIDQANNTNA